MPPQPNLQWRSVGNTHSSPAAMRNYFLSCPVLPENAHRGGAETSTLRISSKPRKRSHWRHPRFRGTSELEGLGD